MSKTSLMLACCAALLAPRSAGSAIIFEAIPEPILEYDPSVRSTAMAGASGAVFWGDAPNHWANPALLGYAQGVRYEDALEHLPTMSIDTGTETLVVESRAIARREVIGYGGLGIAISGMPFDGPGGIRFESKVTDTYPGSPPSTSEFFDEVWSWSVGISASGLVRSFAALSHREAPSFTRYVDVALGYSRKSTGISGRGKSTDWGLLTRAGAPIRLPAATLRIEGAYGYSVLDPTPSITGDTNRRHRNAFSARAALEAAPGPVARTPAWMRSGFQPLISLGGAWDAEHVVSSYDWNETVSGAELALLNVVFLRVGRNASEQTSTGWGLSLPIGSLAGVRYDHSHVDNELEPTRRSWSVWVDPLALIRARR